MRTKTYIQPKNKYNKYAQRCRCGSWLPKGSWVRLERNQVVACVACRNHGHNNHNEENQNVF